MKSNIFELNYSDWNLAITKHFFLSKKLSNVDVVYLAVDDEVLLQIARSQLGFETGDVEPVQKAFVNAVRSKWMNHDSFQMHPIEKRDKNGLPVQIAFLGLLVLAASKMKDDENERATESNYYVRLNELLFGEHRQGYPPGFEIRQHVALWDDLQDWLRSHNLRLNLPERRKDPYYSVQFILWQALLKSSDLFKLTYLFNHSNLQPGQVLKESRLQKLADEWLTQSDCPLSKHAKRVLRERRRALALQQISYHLQNWDGSFPQNFESKNTQSNLILSAQLHIDILSNERGFELGFY